MKKKVPKFKTDEEAEAFLEQDLSDLDFSQFKPMRFEFKPKRNRSICEFRWICSKPCAKAQNGRAFLINATSAKRWNARSRNANARA